MRAQPFIPWLLAAAVRVTGINYVYGDFSEMPVPRYLLRHRPGPVWLRSLPAPLLVARERNGNSTETTKQRSGRVLPAHPPFPQLTLAIVPPIKARIASIVPVPAVF